MSSTNKQLQEIAKRLADTAQELSTLLSQMSEDQPSEPETPPSEEPEVPDETPEPETPVEEPETPEPTQPEEPVEEPSTPEPTEPEAPEETPSYSTGILNTNMRGEWDRGVRLGGTRAVQISGGSTNEQAFAKGTRVKLGDGEERTVVRLERTGGFFNVHLDGNTIYPEKAGHPGELQVVGASNTTPDEPEDHPAPPNMPETPAPTPVPDEDKEPETPKEPEPAQPDEPDSPEQSTGFSAEINDFNGGGWSRGVMKAQDGWVVSVKNTEENRNAFKNGTMVVLANQEIYSIYWPQVNGDNISVHMRGPDIDGTQAGHPNKLSTLTADETLPTPKPPANPEQPERSLGFDMQLFGTNLAGHEFGKGTPHYGLPKESDIVLWKQEGCNAIRLPLGWERLQRSLYGDLDKGEMDKLGEFMGWCHKHGVRVLTDLHNYLRYGKGIVGVDVPANALTDFWTKFAKATKDYPALWAHGIMNEPYVGGDDTGWAVRAKSGGYKLIPHWPAVAKACYDAIQKVDPKRHVAINGDHWANGEGWENKNPNLPLADAPYAIYEFHLYPDVDASGSFKNRSENIPDNALTRRYADVRKWALKHNVMLLCGETNLAWDMKTPGGGKEPYGTAALRAGLKQMIDDKVPVFWWSGGSRWTSSAPNATQFKNELRFPINVLREFKGRKTNQVGPFN